MVISDRSQKSKYKSEGEQKIAEFLNYMEIKYVYEPGVLVKDNGYPRIWYPDFRLPKYEIFIEYFGIENDRIYNERTEHKLDVFRQINIDVIPVYPSTLKGNYGKYIISEIHHIASSRLSDLENKIYRHGLNTFIPRSRSKCYSAKSRPQRNYRR